MFYFNLLWLHCRMTSDQRVAKTHLPFHHLKNQLEKHPEVKVIQTLRDPRDALVSYYHHSCAERCQGYFKGSWDDYFKLVEDKQLAGGDYFDNVVPWYEFNKNRKNSLILRYEAMKQDHRGHVIKIADFIGHKLSNEIVDIIVGKSSFDVLATKYKSNPLPGWHPEREPFVRKGQVGDWQNYFTTEQQRFIDDKIEKYLLPHGILFNINAHL